MGHPSHTLSGSETNKVRKAMCWQLLKSTIQYGTTPTDGTTDGTIDGTTDGTTDVTDIHVVPVVGGVVASLLISRRLEAALPEEEHTILCQLQKMNSLN